MQFITEQRLEDDILEREFTLGEIPGILWTPGSASTPMPLILVSPPPLGLGTAYPRLLARARHSVAEGYAVATIELPGSGDRPRSAAADQARIDLQRAVAAGEPVDDEIVDRLVLPLVEKAVPEWRSTLDALLSLPEIGSNFGGRDHTTVLHACRQIAKLRESLPEMNHDVNFLLQVLRS